MGAGDRNVVYGQFSPICRLTGDNGVYRSDKLADGRILASIALSRSWNEEEEPWCELRSPMVLLFFAFRRHWIHELNMWEGLDFLKAFLREDWFVSFRLVSSRTHMEHICRATVARHPRFC